MTSPENQNRPEKETLDPDSIQQLKDLDESGSNALLDELIDTFLKDAEERLVVLHQALEQGDLKTVSNTAHTLKGGASNFGAKAFTSLCHRIQMAGAETSREEWADLIQILVAEFALLKTALLKHRS